VLKVLIARLELVVFTGILLYIATGPVVWLWRFVQQRSNALARGQAREDA